jgi:hypothetical protein
MAQVLDLPPIRTLLATCAMLAAVACGGGGDDDGDPTAAATRSTTPAATSSATISPSATASASASPDASPAASPSATPEDPATELLDGFEDGIEGWEVAGSITTAEFAATSEFAATGSNSLEVVTLADGEYRGITRRADAQTAVSPGDDFILTLALRAPSTDDIYFVGVSWFDSAGGFIGDAHVEDTPAVADEFEPWELGGTVPDGAATGRVTVYRVTDSAITFYVDDVHYRLRDE